MQMATAVRRLALGSVSDVFQTRTGLSSSALSSETRQLLFPLARLIENFRPVNRVNYSVLRMIHAGPIGTIPAPFELPLRELSDLFALPDRTRFISSIQN